MASYNFFYNPTGGGLSLPPPVQQARLGDYYKKGPCSVPGCRNAHLDLLPRNKCQNCQAQLHFECTHHQNDNGQVWCPYDCSGNVNAVNANHINNQQLQLLQLQQQQQQQQTMQQQQGHQQQVQQMQQGQYQQQLNQIQAQQQAQQLNQQQTQQQVQQPQQQQVSHQPQQPLHPTLQQQQQAAAQQLQQQLQHHQQQLQQQAVQLQQLTAVAAVPPMPTDLGVEPPGGGGVDAELEAAVAAAAFARGGSQQLKRGQLEDDEEEEEDNLPPPPPRKRNKKDNSNKTGSDDGDEDPKEPKKLSRRQQPPKTNITRTRYSNDFKLRVVSELEEPGYGSLTDISKHYGVAEQTLRDWQKHKDKIVDASQRRGNMKANPVDHLKHVTAALLKYMDDHGSSGTDQPITARMIAQKGNEIRNAILAEDAQRPYLTEGERKMTTRFSASLSWGKKWVRQYGRPKTTQVPQDLDGLSKEELVRLLRSVASEREALEQNVAPRKVGGSDLGPGGEATLGANPTKALIAGGRAIPVKPGNLLPFIPSPPRVKVNTVYKVDQAKVRIADTLTGLIKKKAHNWKGRPTTEMTEEVPTLEAARELMEGYTEINKTARSYRWQLTGEQIVEWLGCQKYVHPVKFEGKVVCTIGQPAYVYAFAGFDSMLVKYEQGSSTLTLKVKTYTAGTGNIPGCDEPVFLCNDR